MHEIFVIPNTLEDTTIAAKPDAKSEYITRPALYCVFTKVNRKRVMNTHYANIAVPTADPDAPGTAVRACPGIRLVRHVEWFSGIRSSGQYCRPMNQIRTELSLTAFRMSRGRSPVLGMCP